LSLAFLQLKQPRPPGRSHLTRQNQGHMSPAPTVNGTGALLKPFLGIACCHTAPAHSRQATLSPVPAAPRPTMSEPSDSRDHDA